MFTNAPSSNSGSDIPEVLIPIEQQFSPLSIEACSSADSTERGVHYSVNSPQMIEHRALVAQNNNIQEDNNNGPISARELENIENNNAAVYIISENENRNALSEAIRTREMAIVRLTASRDSVVQFEPLPPNITPSTPTSPSNVRAALLNISEVDQQEMKIVVNDFENRWHHMKPNTIPKIDHVAILPAPTPQAGVLSTADTDSPEPSTSTLDPQKEKASSMSSSIISDKDALVIEHIKSDSLTNLHGSYEDVRGNGRTSDIDTQSQEEIGLLGHPSADSATEICFISQNRSLVGDAQNVDPWLKDVVADAQDDMSYYQDVSDAIKNLDNILNSEKTSSSGSSHQASPSKDVLNSNGDPEMKVSGLVKSPGISNFQSIIEVFPEVEGDNIQQLNKAKSPIYSQDCEAGLKVDKKNERDCDSAVSNISEMIAKVKASSETSECLPESGLPAPGTVNIKIADNSSNVQISLNKSIETPSVSNSAQSSEYLGSGIVKDFFVPSLQDLCNRVRCSLDKVETLVFETNDCNIKAVPEKPQECVSSQIRETSIKCVTSEVNRKQELERCNTASNLITEFGLNKSMENAISDISNLNFAHDVKSDENISNLTLDVAVHGEQLTVSGEDMESEPNQSSNEFNSSFDHRFFMMSNSSEYMEIESPLRPSLVNTLEKLMNDSSFTCNQCGKNLTAGLNYKDLSSTNQYMFSLPESRQNLSPSSAINVPKINSPLSLNTDDVNNLNRNDNKLSTSTPRSNNDDSLLAESAGTRLVVESAGNDILSISSIKPNYVDKTNVTDDKLYVAKPRYCKDCLTTVQKLELTCNEDNTDNNSSVIIGPFENCTLDLYTGLKTHLPGEDVRFENELIPEEEHLAFSSTLNDIEPCEDEISPENTSSLRIDSLTANNNQTIHYSVEPWDRFLGNSFENLSQGNSFDIIFDNKAEDKVTANQKQSSTVSSVDDNANICVAGPSSDNTERLQLRVNAEAESRRRRQLMDFNSDITTKLAIAENENNLNIEYSGPVLVEESIVNDLGDYSTDSNEEHITETVRVQLNTPNDNLDQHIVVSCEDDDTIINDIIEITECEENTAETELESLKALRDELELKLPLAQACHPVMEKTIAVKEEPLKVEEVSSQVGKEACSSSCDVPTTGSVVACDEMLISYQMSLSPIVEETCSEVSAYENDKTWFFSQHTDSSETYPEADYNLTDEIYDIVLTLGSEPSARTSTESAGTSTTSAGNQTNSDSDIDKTYVIKDTDSQPISTEMTMSADSLNCNEEDSARLRDTPTNSNNASPTQDELTHTLLQHQDPIQTLSPIADYQQISQVSQPSAFDDTLINESTQGNAVSSLNVHLNSKIYSPLSEVSKPSFVSDHQSSKVKTSKATSMNSWCSNDTLFNVEEDFEDFTCTPHTTPTPRDFVRDVNSANDVYFNIPQHDSNSISPDSISENKTYTKTDVPSAPHSISTCTAEAFIQSHILDKRPSIELMRRSPCPDSLIEATLPHFVDTTDYEPENILTNSKISLHMTKLDSIDLECLDETENEGDISATKSDSDKKSDGTKSPTSHYKIAYSATSTPKVTSSELEDEGEKEKETDNKLTDPQNYDGHLNFTESFIDMQFDFLDTVHSEKPNEPTVTMQNKTDDISSSSDHQKKICTDLFQYLQFEQSVDQRKEGLEESNNSNVLNAFDNMQSLQTDLSPIVDSDATTNSASEIELDCDTDNSSTRSVEDVTQYVSFEHSAFTKPQDLSVLPVVSNLGSEVMSIMNCDAQDASLQLSNDTTLYTHFEQSATEKLQDLSVLPEESSTNSISNSENEELNIIWTESLKLTDAVSSDGITLHNSLDILQYTTFEGSASEKPQDLSKSSNLSLDSITSEALSSKQTIFSQSNNAEINSEKTSSDISQYSNFERSAAGKPQDETILETLDQEELLQHRLVENEISPIFKINEDSAKADISFLAYNPNELCNLMSTDFSQMFINFEKSAAEKPQDLSRFSEENKNKLDPMTNSDEPTKNRNNSSAKADLSLLAYNPTELCSPMSTDVSEMFINFEKSAAEKPQDLSSFSEENKNNLDPMTISDGSTNSGNNLSGENPSINLDLSCIKSDTTTLSSPSMYTNFNNSALRKPQDMSIICQGEPCELSLKVLCQENSQNSEKNISPTDTWQYVDFEPSVLQRHQDFSVSLSSTVPTNSMKINNDNDLLNRKLQIINTDILNHNAHPSLPSPNNEQNIDRKSQIRESDDKSQDLPIETSMYGNFEQSASIKPQDLSNLAEGVLDIVGSHINVDELQNIISPSCDISPIETSEDVSSLFIQSASSNENIKTKNPIDLDQSIEHESSIEKLCSDNDISHYSNFEKSALEKSQDLCGLSETIPSLKTPNKIDKIENLESVSPNQNVESLSHCENKIVEDTPEYANFDCSVKDKPQDLSPVTNVKDSENDVSPKHTPLKNCNESKESQNEKSDFHNRTQMPTMSAQVEVIQSQSPNQAFIPADIRFSGPASDDIMSTSFNQEPDGKVADDAYSCNAAPETLKEWDSDSDDSHNSSSSGEFVWKGGEREEPLYTTSVTDNHRDQRQAATCGSAELTTIEEECRSISSSSCSDDERSDEEVEFVPSSWDCRAEPTKSSMRNVEANFADKKKVVFKKQKYHCVYEYPREVTEVEGDSMHSPFLPDYSTYSDWELMGLQDPCRANYDQLVSDFPMDNLYQLLDTSSLSNMATPDEDFFISSSTRPFESLGIMTTSSQFFPGRPAGFKDMDINIPPDDLINGVITEKIADPVNEGITKSNDNPENETIQYNPKLNSVDFITPDSGMEDVTPGSALDYDINTENPDTKINSIAPPVIPYWDKQINRNRHFRTLMLPSQGTSSSESLTPTSPLTSTSSESPLSPQTLGGLRHTRDKLKLDLPPSPLNMHSPSILSGRYSNKDLKVFDFRNIDFNNLSKRDLVEKSNELRNREETPSDAECDNEHENTSDNTTNSSEDALDNHSVTSSDLPLNNENIITDVMIPTPTFSTFGINTVKKSNSSDKIILLEDKSAADDITDIIQKADSETTDVSDYLSQQSSPQSSQSELLQKSVLPIQEKIVDNKPAIEPVKGEGTLLDSGDEDSGIESSARTTLERNIEVAKV